MGCDSTVRFSSRVEFYLRSRPRYPHSVLSFLRDKLNFKSTHVVADIGSGTGFLTQLFVSNGNETFAVEPNADMRAAGENLLRDYANFHSINGTAEATTLPPQCVDFITAGQAFHWFDPVKARREFLRILRLPGWVALVWNDRRLEKSNFASDYQQMIDRFSTDHAAVRACHITAVDDATLRKFFSPGGYELATFDNPQTLTRAGLIDRVTSSSYMPLPQESSYSEMMCGIEDLFDSHQHEGEVIMPQETRVYYGRLS
jgi:SAM-dependent methyltransferase